MNMYLNKVLFGEQTIQKRVAQLSLQINNDYKFLFEQNLSLHIVGVLNGAFMFLADLIRGIYRNTIIDFVALSSYGSGTESSGVITILKDIKVSVENQYVLIVEDIIDTGLTLQFLKDYIFTRNPKDIKICCLLDKKCKRVNNIVPDYVGFEIPDEFVVGYGLDYNGQYRGLESIWCLQDQEKKL